MPAKPRLRVIEGDRPHPRDLAALAVRKRKQQPSRPIVNQHTEVVRPTLPVDEILRRSEGAGLGKK